MKLPEMYRVRQKLDNTCLQEIEASVKAELDKLGLKLKKDSRIAITAGSRGINNITAVIKACVDYVRDCGAQPCIVPAMGSHGGATVEGQIRVLRELGIEPELVGAPIFASMDTEIIDTLELDVCRECQGDGSSDTTKACQKNRPLDSPPVSLPVYMDKYAFESDGIIVVNRVKPHTSFHSVIESGMMKMMTVGLGKGIQAANIHGFGTRGLKELILPMARKVIASGKIIAGLGLLENANDRLMEVRAFLPEEIEAGEKEMLSRARCNMPCLPVDTMDLLIVDEMGKNFSGTGMDTNIIGRLRIEGEPEPDKPYIKRIVVLDLSSGADGNAYGMGLADFTVKKLVEKIDYTATYANVLTTNFVERAKIPVIAEDEEEAVSLALKTCGIKDMETARIIRISNTLQLEYVSVSKSIYEEIKGRVDIV